MLLVCNLDQYIALATFISYLTTMTCAYGLLLMILIDNKMPSSRFIIHHMDESKKISTITAQRRSLHMESLE